MTTDNTAERPKTFGELFTRVHLLPHGKDERIDDIVMTFAYDGMLQRIKDHPLPDWHADAMVVLVRFLKHYMCALDKADNRVKELECVLATERDAFKRQMEETSELVRQLRLQIEELQGELIRSGKIPRTTS